MLVNGCPMAINRLQLRFFLLFLFLTFGFFSILFSVFCFFFLYCVCVSCFRFFFVFVLVVFVAFVFCSSFLLCVTFSIPEPAPLCFLIKHRPRSASHLPRQVGRVEQMEYRLAKKAGDRSLVQRQLCQIITLGTLTEEEMLLDHRPNYLLAVKEDPSAAAYGVCFVDAARGEFHVARLEDTVHRAELATLLHRTKPKELIIERDNLSKVPRTLATAVLEEGDGRVFSSLTSTRTSRCGGGCR